MNRLHSRRVDIHLIPCRLNYTIPQQLQLQSPLLGRLANISANIFTLLNKLGLLQQINHEFIALKLFDISDALILAKQIAKLLLDDGQLLHDLLFE